MAPRSGPRPRRRARAHSATAVDVAPRPDWAPLNSRSLSPRCMQLQKKRVEAPVLTSSELVTQRSREIAHARRHRHRRGRPQLVPPGEGPVGPAHDRALRGLRRATQEVLRAGIQAAGHQGFGRVMTRRSCQLVRMSHNDSRATVAVTCRPDGAGRQPLTTPQCCIVED